MAMATPNDGDWIVVIPRRGKHKSSKTLNLKSLSLQKPWIPTDSESDPARESKLLHKIESSIRKLESSDFFRSFLDQLQDPQMHSNFSRVLNSENQFQLVIYGIGSIESYDPPRLQLSLAILLKRKFDWIGEIEVFDPIISEAESKVLEVFGCRVLSIDEQGRREALKPTLFFMPHCEAFLYDNLIEANWRPELLNRVVIFGNSFERYGQIISEFKTNRIVESARYMLESRRFVKEVGIDIVSEDFNRAFHETSWHFFHLDSKMELKKF